MLKKSILVAAALAITTTAQAQDVSGYLQGSLGYAKAKKADLAEVNRLVDYGKGTVNKYTDTSDTAYKFLVGLQLNSFIALEAQYTDLGSIRLKDKENKTLKIKNRGYGANLVGTLPVQDLTLFVKAGAHRIKSKASADYYGSVTKNVTSFGAGASYNITPELTLVADYDHYRKIAKIKKHNINVGSLGLRYNF